LEGIEKETGLPVSTDRMTLKKLLKAGKIKLYLAAASSLLLTAALAGCNLSTRLGLVQTLDDESTSPEFPVEIVEEVYTSVATLPKAIPTTELVNKPVSLEKLPDDLVLRVCIDLLSNGECVDLSQSFENFKNDPDVLSAIEGWENPEITATGYQTITKDGAETLYLFFSIVSGDDEAITYMVTSDGLGESGEDINYQALERFVDDEGMVGLGYTELANGKELSYPVMLFSSMHTEKEFDELLEEYNVLFVPADKFIAPENLPGGVMKNLLASPVEVEEPSNEELAAEEAEAEARKKITEQILNRMREEWREAGYRKNGEIYSEHQKVTGKSRTTEFEADCVRYDHLAICTDQQYVNSELNYQLDWGTKRLGEMLMANPRIPESEEMAGRIGAFMYANNIADHFPDSGIDINSPEWYDQFMVWLDKNPGIKYEFNVSKPDSQGVTHAVTLGMVDPRLPFKVVYMMPKFNDERIRDSNFTGTSNNTPYDFWIKTREAFLQVEITPEGQLVVYNCGVSPEDWLWGREKKGGNINWPFKVAAKRNMRSSNASPGLADFGEWWSTNFYQDYKYGGVKPNSNYLSWERP